MRASNRFAPFLLLITLLGLPLVSPAAAETAPTPAPHIERITQVGKLWGVVKYLHPYLAYRDIDWDKALVDALPRVRDAKTSEEYAAAVQSMLDALGDPATRVLPQETATAPTDPPDPGTPPEVVRKLDDGVVLLDLTAANRLKIDDLYQQIGGIIKQLTEAPSIIVDVRGLGASSYYAYNFLEEVQGTLVSVPLRAPRPSAISSIPATARRTAAARAATTPDSSRWRRTPSHRLPALPRSRSGWSSWSRPGDYIPSLVLALQATGVGSLVAEGPLTEEAILESSVLDLGEGIRARVRVSELMPLPGWTGFHVDAEVDAGPERAGPGRGAGGGPARADRARPHRFHDVAAGCGLPPRPDLSGHAGAGSPPPLARRDPCLECDPLFLSLSPSAR